MGTFVLDPSLIDAHEDEHGEVLLALVTAADSARTTNAALSTRGGLLPAVTPGRSSRGPKVWPFDLFDPASARVTATTTAISRTK